MIKKIRYFSLMLLLMLFACNTIIQDGKALRGRVIKIQDGDTITILVDNTQHKIRLAEIDCPESKQAFGQKAKQFTSDMVFGEIVKVVYEEQDRYQRILGTVYTPDGKNLNQELVKAGLAWHYKQYSKSVEMARLEDEARQAGIGLWKDKDPIPPWEYRKQKRSK